MIFDKKNETMARDELSALQLARLKKTLEKVENKVEFYKDSFKKAKVSSADIKSLDDLRRLPFTTKNDLRDNYPFKMFAEPMKNIVRIHASSGTTGKATVVAYTANDIDLWANLMARSLCAAGATPDDIIHNAYGYGLFTGGLGVHYGAEKLGATVIPVSGGNTERQINILKDFSPTVLTSTPSYSLHLAEVAHEKGFDPKVAFKLKVGIFGAEPWSEAMREEIEKIWGIDALDIYGLSEIIGPGVAMECQKEKSGLHFFEDHFIAEIIDPNTLESLPYGEKGELVITSLTKEAFPIIRYRTRDITSINPEPCSCGRTHARIQRLSGRTDDMLIIRGVNVFPSQIEHILMQINEVEPHYILEVSKEGHLDMVTIKVEVNAKIFSDKIKGLQDLEKRIVHKIKDLIGISVKVKLVEPKSIQRSEGKAKRIIDLRN